MEELLSSLYSSSNTPVLSALVLGLLTAISPCPMATNITAIGFISRDIEQKNKVFYNGIVYTAGRAASYTLLAFILYAGADQLQVSAFFQQYGERFIGPLLIVIGIFMLGLIHFSFGGLNKLTGRFAKKKKHSYTDAFLLGFIFALAFCPYSGVLYFGMLMPMTIQTAGGLYLPLVFAAATGIPVLIFAWLLAFTVSGVGRLYNKLKIFENWFRKIMAVLFIAVGCYHSYIVFIN